MFFYIFFKIERVEPFYSKILLPDDHFIPHLFTDNYLTIRLFALDFYRVIVDKGEARINYREIEIESE